jgi:hypothetical protein
MKLKSSSGRGAGAPSWAFAIDDASIKPAITGMANFVMPNTLTRFARSTLRIGAQEADARVTAAEIFMYRTAVNTDNQNRIQPSQEMTRRRSLN